MVAEKKRKVSRNSNALLEYCVFTYFKRQFEWKKQKLVRAVISPTPRGMAG
jgi:hypothetical protein